MIGNSSSCLLIISSTSNIPLLLTLYNLNPEDVVDEEDDI
jgi:hypothetical protein